MQGIVIETREVSPETEGAPEGVPHYFSAEVVDGPKWARNPIAFHPEREGAFKLLCADLRGRWRGRLDFIHVPE